MPTNRIQHLMYEQLPANGPALMQGFMPCPVVLLSALPANQQFAIVEVYRLAHERTQEALRSDVRPWDARLQFSLN